MKPDPNDPILTGRNVRGDLRMLNDVMPQHGSHRWLALLEQLRREEAGFDRFSVDEIIEYRRIKAEGGAA